MVRASTCSRNQREPKEATMSAQLDDAMAVTRERLTDVANVWKELAQAKLSLYLEKLPESVGRYVKPKVTGPAEVVGGSVDAPST